MVPPEIKERLYRDRYYQQLHHQAWWRTLLIRLAFWILRNQKGKFTISQRIEMRGL